MQLEYLTGILNKKEFPYISWPCEEYTTTWFLWYESCFDKEYVLLLPAGWLHENVRDYCHGHVFMQSQDPENLETPLWKLWSKSTIESISLKDNILLHTWTQVLFLSLTGEKRTKVGGHAGMEVSSQIWLWWGEGDWVQHSLQRTHTYMCIYESIYTKRKICEELLEYSVLLPGEGVAFCWLLK